MAQTPEGKVKDWLVLQIRREYPDAWIYKAPGGRFGRAGVPDLLCSWDGIFVAIEVKTDIGKLTPRQKYELDKLDKSDAVTATIYGKDKEALERVFEEVYQRRADNKIN